MFRFFLLPKSVISLPTTTRESRYRTIQKHRGGGNVDVVGLDDQQVFNGRAHTNSARPSRKMDWSGLGKTFPRRREWKAHKQYTNKQGNRYRHNKLTRKKERYGRHRLHRKKRKKNGNGIKTKPGKGKGIGKNAGKAKKKKVRLRRKRYHGRRRSKMHPNNFPTLTQSLLMMYSENPRSSMSCTAKTDWCTDSRECCSCCCMKRGGALRCGKANSCTTCLIQFEPMRSFVETLASPMYIPLVPSAMPSFQMLDSAELSISKQEEKATSGEVGNNVIPLRLAPVTPTTTPEDDAVNSIQPGFQKPSLPSHLESSFTAPSRLSPSPPTIASQSRPETKPFPVEHGGILPGIDHPTPSTPASLISARDGWGISPSLTDERSGPPRAGISSLLSYPSVSPSSIHTLSEDIPKRRPTVSHPVGVNLPLEFDDAVPSRLETPSVASPSNRHHQDSNFLSLQPSSPFSKQIPIHSGPYFEPSQLSYTGRDKVQINSLTPEVISHGPTLASRVTPISSLFQSDSEVPNTFLPDPTETYSPGLSQPVSDLPQHLSPGGHMISGASNFGSQTSTPIVSVDKTSLTRTSSNRWKSPSITITVAFLCVAALVAYRLRCGTTKTCPRDTDEGKNPSNSILKPSTHFEITSEATRHDVNLSVNSPQLEQSNQETAACASTRAGHVDDETHFGAFGECGHFIPYWTVEVGDSPSKSKKELLLRLDAVEGITIGRPYSSA